MRNSEIQINFKVDDLTLRGVLHLPRNASTPPAVALCHGYFQSNRIGPSALYVKLARELTASGIACLRFDCRGMGESDGRFEDVSYESFLEDLHTATDYLKNQENINSQKLGLIGHSMGANIALDVASALPYLKGLCLLSPDSTSDLSKVTLLSEEQISELKIKGFTERKGIISQSSFVLPILKGISYQRANQITAVTLIIQGANDQYYTMDGLRNLSGTFGKKPTIIEIAKANHNFYPTSCRNHLAKVVTSWFMKVFNLEGK